MSGIWGSEFAEDATGEIKYIKNVVSFTEKTRFIFEISKGLRDNRKTPYDVNKHMAQENRPVPLENMIYVGDGLTDVPCFSLLDHFRGQGFGVFDPKKDGSPKKALEQLVAPKRVSSLNAPKYRKTDELGVLLRTAVNQKCSAFDLRMKSALH